MRILLTGGSGFVGLRTLMKLAVDHEVICIGRTNPSIDNVSFINVDISDGNSVREAASHIEGDFDAIVHLAAHVPKEKSEDVLSDTKITNIDGTVNLLESFQGRFKKLIIGSTAEVYDQTKIQGVLTEDSVVGSASYYGATKLASELIAQAYGLKNDVKVIVLRFSIMYGPSDPIARALPNFIKKALGNETIEIVGGQILRDYIHIDDVVWSIEQSLRASEARGVINIGSGVGVSIVDAAKEVIAITKSTSELVVRDGSGGADIVINPDSAKRLINFEAINHFPNGLSEMVDSYRHTI